MIVKFYPKLFLCLVALISWLTFAATSFAAEQDGVSCDGGTYLFRNLIDNGSHYTTHSGTIFYWYENTVKQTGTIAQEV